MKVNSKPQEEVKKDSGLRAIVLNSKQISDGSGAPPKKYQYTEYISNSYTSVLDRELTGKAHFFGNEKFLKFGHELHKRVLKPKEAIERLTKDEEALLVHMINALDEYPWLRKEMKGAKLEKLHVKPIKLYGNVSQEIKVILDIEKRYRGTDLKTTSCTTENAFINAAKEYGYFKQAFLYSKVQGLDEFVFIGVSKKPPYKIFHLNVNDYPLLKMEGEDQGMRLIHTHHALKAYYNGKLQPL